MASPQGSAIPLSGAAARDEPEEVPADDLTQRVSELERAVNRVSGADTNRSEASSVRPSISAEGRFDFDNGWYRAPQDVQNSLATPLEDGTAFRRFRLGVNGSTSDQFEFRLEADLSKASDFKSASSGPVPSVFITHAWVAMNDLPLIDTVRIGHQKEYLTFSNATSSSYLPFMERPYIYDAFENDFSYDSGISLNRTYFDEQVATWVGGFWNGTQSQAFSVGGHHGVSGRLTWMPVYSATDQRWLNFSVSGSLRPLNANDPNELTVRPLLRTGQSSEIPKIIDTGPILSLDGLQILGAGVHAARGPWTVGSEFLCWAIHDAFGGGLPNPDGTLPPGVQPLGNSFFSGYYVEILYFLTPGDHRSVNRIIPGYERIRPVRSFFRLRDACGDCERGPGAWEVGVRYDHLAANSGLIQAGTLDSITWGVNWYLNANTRLTANYVFTSRDTASPTSSGDFGAFGLRAHVDF